MEFAIKVGNLRRFDARGVVRWWRRAGEVETRANRLLWEDRPIQLHWTDAEGVKRFGAGESKDGYVARSADARRGVSGHPRCA